MKDGHLHALPTRHGMMPGNLATRIRGVESLKLQRRIQIILVVPGPGSGPGPARGQAPGRDPWRKGAAALVGVMKRSRCTEASKTARIHRIFICSWRRSSLPLPAVADPPCATPGAGHPANAAADGGEL